LEQVIAPEDGQAGIVPALGGEVESRFPRHKQCLQNQLSPNLPQILPQVGLFH